MKRKQRAKQRLLIVDIFSPAEIKLAQDAIMRFEDWLSQLDKEEVNKAFAAETAILVKSKLERIRTTRDNAALLDYNENLLLLAAIQNYMTGLIANSPTPQLAGQIKQCEHIQAFAIQGIQAAPANPTQD